MAEDSHFGIRYLGGVQLLHVWMSGNNLILTIEALLSNILMHTEVTWSLFHLVHAGQFIKEIHAELSFPTSDLNFKIALYKLKVTLLFPCHLFKCSILAAVGKPLTF